MIDSCTSPASQDLSLCGGNRKQLAAGALLKIFMAGPLAEQLSKSKYVLVLVLAHVHVACTLA
eukprot:scaffold162_cov143-Skeletonema_menzelii.AAC.16